MKRSLALVGLTALAGYAAYRFWQLTSLNRMAGVSDYAGNYDIDGVSYDRDAGCVVVSGDQEREHQGIELLH